MLSFTLPRRFLTALMVTSLLVTPVTASDLSAPASGYNVADDAYSRYLVGRYAMINGDTNGAAEALRSASERDPSDAVVRERAFVVSLLNGDIGEAVRLRPESSDDRFTRVMALMAGVVDAVARDNPKQALAELDAVQALNANYHVAVLVRPYVLAMNSKWKDAFAGDLDAMIGESDADRLMVLLLKAERARLYEIRGKRSKAEAIYKELYQPGAASVVFGPDYGAFLERRGRRKEAEAVYLEIARSGDSTANQIALKRVRSRGKAPPRLTLRQGMARAMYVAATFNYTEQESELALVHVQMARHLGTGSGQEYVFLGQLLSEMKDHEGARRAWRSVAETSVYYEDAGLQIVDSLRNERRLDEALALNDNLLARNPSSQTLMLNKAGILFELKRPDEALSIINAYAETQGTDQFTWQAWYLKAILHETQGDWVQAEASIEKARALNPKRPEILNFLGYGWIDRNVRVEEGMELVRQALAVNPRSGEMLDSLGWGYYRLGDYPQALTYIEQAVQIVPGEGEILLHLGDVYFAVGRTVEARYQWQRVLSLGSSAEIEADARRRLDQPVALDAATPASSVR